MKVRNFDIINSILDKATADGANTIGGIQFTIDDMEKVRAEARAKAIDQAKAKAKVLADQTGLSIDRLVDISEGYGSAPVPYYAFGKGGATMDSSVAPEIQTGQMEIDLSVTLTYRVR